MSRVYVADSLVYGFGDPEGGGWVERLRRSWMSPDSAGHIVYNLGVRGDRTQQVAQRLEKEATRIACSKRRIPYLDIFERWIARGENWRRKRLSQDGLHPNTQGYQALLEDVMNWEAIATYNSQTIAS